MAGSLSFLSFSVFGEQEGICVDCVKGDQTEWEIQNLNKLTCQKMMRNPECVNIPGVFKANCNNYDPNRGIGAELAACLVSAGVGVAGIYAALMKMLQVMESMTAAGKFATLVRRSAIAAAVTVGVGALYFGYQFHKAKRESAGKARSEGWTKKQHTDYAYATVLTLLANRIYSLAYNDAHCYNPLARGVRVCGAITAIVGVHTVGGGVIASGLAAAGGPTIAGIAAVGGSASAGLALIGIGMGSREEEANPSLHAKLNKEFNKVRSEVEAKIKESKGPSFPEEVERHLRRVQEE